MSVTVPSNARYVVFDVESVGLLGEPWAIGWVAMNSIGVEVASGCTWAYPMEVDPSASSEDYDFALPAVESLAATTPAVTPEQVLRDLWDLWVQTRSAGATFYCDVFSPVDGHALRQAFVNAKKRGVAVPLEDSPRVLDIHSIVTHAGIKRNIASSNNKHHPVDDARASWNRLRYMLWTHIHNKLPAK